MQSVVTDALGTSDVFLAFQERVARAARAARPVLVLGERGTGKELAAQRLHYLSSRWEGPLVTVLCPALSPTLLESELFGHEAGAFTGARGRHEGCFERAHRGTLFLDEVADMPLPVQDKLLRVLEYGEFERVGGSVPVRVDVRVVAAANRDLPRLVAEGKFRPDLLDRLAFDVLHVPPLRERGEDKLLLARYFAARMVAELDSRGIESGPGFEFQFGEEALRQLEEYSWPGNVRELRNAVERGVLHAEMKENKVLRVETLDLNPFAPVFLPPAVVSDADAVRVGEPETAPENGMLPPGFSLREELARQEKALLQRALRQARHRQKEAARLLGLTYHQFRALYRKYDGLEKEGEGLFRRDKQNMDSA